MHKLYNTYGIETLGPIEDVMVAQHLLNENERHGLAAIAKNWLKIDSWKFKQDGHFNVWPLKMATTYLGSDCELTLRVHEWQNCEAEGTFPVLPELAKLYYEVELPNVEIARSEHRLFRLLLQVFPAFPVSVGMASISRKSLSRKFKVNVQQQNSVCRK